MDDAERHRLKLVFARNLLVMNDPGKAGFATSNGDIALGLQIAYDWPKDPVVQAEQMRLLQDSKNNTELLPSKQSQARDIYLIATNPNYGAEERLKAHRLYAEIMGHIEKPAQAVPGGVLVQNVMVVPMAKSMDEWENMATQQQAKLIEHASIQ